MYGGSPRPATHAAVEFIHPYASSCWAGGSKHAGCNLSVTHTHPYVRVDEVGKVLDQITCRGVRITTEELARGVNNGGMIFSSKDTRIADSKDLEAHLGVSDRSAVKVYRRTGAIGTIWTASP